MDQGLMDAEPILLYSSRPADFSLLSYRPEDSPEANYLAIPERDRRRKIPLRDHRPAFEDELKRSGGVWTSVVRPSTDRFELTARTYPRGNYLPPNQILVLGADGRITAQGLSVQAMQFHAKDCVVLPVDLASEKQLVAWIEGLKGLPGDLGQAVIQGIVNDGLANPKRPAFLPPNDDVEITRIAADQGKGVPGWIWIVLAGVVGLALGMATLFTGIPGSMKPSASLIPAAQPVAKQTAVTTPVSRPAHTTETTPPDDANQKKFEDGLRKLEGALGKSTVPAIKQLLRSSDFPEFLQPGLEPVRRELEAWMIVRLVMFEQSPTDAAWSKFENVRSNADGVFAKNSDDNGSAAIKAAFCSAGLAAKRIDCEKVNWSAAENEFESLASLAAAPPDAGLPQHTPKDKSGKDKTGGNK